MSDYSLSQSRLLNIFFCLFRLVSQKKSNKESGLALLIAPFSVLLLRIALLLLPKPPLQVVQGKVQKQTRVCVSSVIEGTEARNLQNNMLLTKTQKDFTDFFNMDCFCFRIEQNLSLPIACEQNTSLLVQGVRRQSCEHIDFFTYRQFKFTVSLYLEIQITHSQDFGSYMYNNGAKNI